MTKYIESRISLNAQEKETLMAARKILEEILELAGDHRSQMDLHHVEEASDELFLIFNENECEWTTYK